MLRSLKQARNFAVQKQQVLAQMQITEMQKQIEVDLLNQQKTNQKTILISSLIFLF
jgi:hypothetical protein